MSERVAWLVFDIETVVDGRLVQAVRFPDEPQLAPAEAIRRWQSQLLASGKSDFIPHTFHLPVAVAIARVAPDCQLLDIKNLDRPRFRPQVIARQFWGGWRRYLERQPQDPPCFVTFNGRFFDLPVMEHAAYRFGIGVPEWFRCEGPGYQQPRSRFNLAYHFDVQDFLTNAGAVHASGGLDLFARLVGGVGKMETKGHMVQELWERGERERIDDYCTCDAIDTYLVFLRCQLLAGRIDAAAEAQGWASAQRVAEQLAPRSVIMAEYARRLRQRPPPADDEDPFWS
ncbi:MAG: 3'-5' exonuclease [Planctomycetota bacterium]|nr:3'-5' exonuclease [Planctomycetota bacterium]MCX8039847.1 3'-5' exonuclease [Planctomycetota bacterium]MDW8372822.1 3'-5' exonuclease [Planctomycetota bacterium]